LDHKVIAIRPQSGGGSLARFGSLRKEKKGREKKEEDRREKRGARHTFTCKPRRMTDQLTRASLSELQGLKGVSED